MRAWLLMLGGLIVWAAHFFTLYTLASVFGSSLTARIGTGLLTIVAVAADILLLLAIARGFRSKPDDFDSWVLWLGALGAALSLVAILWQGFPALLS